MSSAAGHPASDSDRDPAVAARVEQLYASHAALVRSICRSLLRDRSEAEDAVQQTFLSAQRALVNGSSPRDTRAWLATIARHESLARVQARMREPLHAEIDEHGAAPDAHAAAVRRHEAGELRDALAELPAQQREAILLREVRGLSYQEVAAALSVTTSAVESLLFRARRSLQTRLREALAALSPATWVQPLRELLARLVGGGVSAPVAAKVAAVGLGTAVVAGGALDGPRVLGLGHAPKLATHSARAPRHRPPESAAPHAPVTFWPTPRPSAVVAGVRLQSGESSDRQSTSGASEGEHTDTSGTAAGDGSSASGSEVGDGGSTRQVASGPTEDSTSGSGGSSSDATATASSSDATATDSGTSGD